MDKQDTIFRQKSIERVSSPEQLDSYLKVTSPSVWLALIGIIVVLTGAIVWGSVGKLKSYTNVGCVVTNGQTNCYIKEADGHKVKSGMAVEIPDENTEFEIISIDNKGLTIPNNDSYLQHLTGVNGNEFVFTIKGNCNLNDGYYAGRVVTETISALEFILN